MNATAPAIRCTGLRRDYGDHTALHGLDLEVAPGRLVGFLGPNGAGKTTTLRILAGALAASDGKAEVCGHDVLDHPQAVKRAVGFLPEVPPLYDDAPVEGYLRYAGRLKGVDDLRAAVDRAIALADLEEVRHTACGHLSKGFRQRVGLAQALVHRPRVLLLDEPASGLDPAQRAAMRRLVRDLADGDVTVVLSTHVLAEIEAVCDEVVILHRGRVVGRGDLDALVPDAAPVRVRVARPEGLADALRALRGVLRVDAEADGTLRVTGEGDLRPAIGRIASAHDLLQLDRVHALEETFLRLTRDDAP